MENFFQNEKALKDNILTNSMILDTIILLLICLLIIIHCWIWLKTRRRIEKYNDFPKVIWTYWNDKAAIPDAVQLCIDSWRKHNPDFSIKILDNDDFQRLCDIDLEVDFTKYGFHPNKFARYADIVRIAVLKKFGGIWMDSTNICMASLEWAYTDLDLDKELVGFYGPQTSRPYDYPILENWFFSVMPNSHFLLDWWDEVILMYSYDTEMDYVNHIKTDQSIDLQNLDSFMPYLIMHLCANVVLQRKKRDYRLSLSNAIDVNGPFYYLAKVDWNSELALKSLIDQTIDLSSTPLIKLRGYEREFIMINRLESSVRKSLDS
jgi:hypothetical protein